MQDGSSWTTADYTVMQVLLLMDKLSGMQDEMKSESSVFLGA